MPTLDQRLCVLEAATAGSAALCFWCECERPNSEPLILAEPCPHGRWVATPHEEALAELN
jgi:hypothetical protein